MKALALGVRAAGDELTAQKALAFGEHDAGFEPLGIGGGRDALGDPGVDPGAGVTVEGDHPEDGAVEQRAEGMAASERIGGRGHGVEHQEVGVEGDRLVRRALDLMAAKRKRPRDELDPGRIGVDQDDLHDG